MPPLVLQTRTCPAGPVISVTPDKLHFGNQTVNTKSAAQALTVANTGTAALEIASITASAPFAQTNNCGASVASKAQCKINVTFKPTGTGLHTGVVTITSNAGNSPDTVQLYGTGVSVAVTVSPSTLSFANQAVGTTGESQPVTITNNQTTSLTFTSIVASGGFVQSNNCPASLAAATSCTVEVSFAPVGLGLQTGTVTITDNATGSPQKVSLSGTAFGATQTSLSSSLNPSLIAEGVTFTTTVTSNAGEPFGEVTFHDGPNLLGSEKLNSAGVASWQTATLAAGRHSITTRFEGNATYATSAAGMTEDVKIPSTVTITSAIPNPADYGQAVTLVANVATLAGSPTPTGTVSFHFGTTSLGSVALDALGNATLVTRSTALPSRADAVTASYSGNVDYAAGVSGEVTVTVLPASTSTSLSSAPNPSAAGQTVTFTATVTSSAGITPTANVQFKDGTTVLGVVGLNSSGVATYSTAGLAAGTHSIRAVFVGGVNFTRSISPVLTQTVK